MLSCRAVVALDGGIGTLSELAVVWSARQTEEGAPALIAVGDRWRRILGELSTDLVASAADFDLVTVVNTPAEALEAIRSPKEVPRPGARG
jgi:predicted Rossmann-fold nucleotide-binding protein